jgi:hypothetical protein
MVEEKNLIENANTSDKNIVLDSKNKIILDKFIESFQKMERNELKIASIYSKNIYLINNIDYIDFKISYIISNIKKIDYLKEYSDLIIEEYLKENNFTKENFDKNIIIINSQNNNPFDRKNEEVLREGRKEQLIIAQNIIKNINKKNTIYINEEFERKRRLKEEQKIEKELLKLKESEITFINKEEFSKKISGVLSTSNNYFSVLQNKISGLKIFNRYGDKPNGDNKREESYKQPEM